MTPGTSAFYVYLRRHQAEYLVFFSTSDARDALYRLFAVNVNKALVTKWRVVSGTIDSEALGLITEGSRQRNGPVWTELPTGQQVRTELVLRSLDVAVQHGRRRSPLEVAA